MTVVVACICALSLVPPASAHTKLVESDPSDGESITAPLSQLTLTFSTNVSSKFREVRVIDESGSNIAKPARVAQTLVTVPITPTRSGTHTVLWRTVGDDGHAISGEFDFVVRSGAIHSSPSAPVAQESRPDASTKTHPYPISSVTRMITVSQALLYLSLFIAAGGALFATIIAPGWRPRFFRTACYALLLASLGRFFASLAIAGEYSPLGVVNPWNIVPFILTPTGRVSIGCALGALVLLRLYPPLERAAKTRDRRMQRGVAATAIFVCVIPAFGGHAWISPVPLVRVPADMLHLLAAAIWFGCIIQLKDVSAASLAKHPSVYPAVRMFARCAFAAVVTLVATGIVAVLLEVGLDPAELAGTTYGQLVLLKIGLLLLTLPFAKANQQRHVPALAERSRAASVRLRRYVIFEIVLVTIIVAVSAWLVMQTPPRHADMGHDLHSSG